MTTTTTQAAQAATAAERNKTTMRRIYAEAFDQGQTEVLDECCSPDIRNHAAPPAQQRGVQPIRDLVAMLRAAFPDGRIVIEDMIAEGDVVVMRNWYQGTHLGAFLGHEATGRPFRFRQTHWMRFGPDGRVIEHWGVRDDVTHLQQLGIIN